MNCRGKSERWIQEPVTQLKDWAVLNDASFNGVRCADAGEGRGSGLFATRDLKGGEEAPLLTVPRDLVLSLETVKLAAKSDKDLRELLEALGDFVLTSRGAILTFLLYTLTVTAGRQKGYHVGSLTPLNQYINTLPGELLPTFWTDDEIELLSGTSIHAALPAKQKSLAREFGHLVEATQDIRWCNDLWWAPCWGLEPLCLEDWKAVDAMYRSRALEFPGIGDAMVPCVDMANHAAGADTSALYETDSEGNALLLLRDGVNIKEGAEVTITYGDNKGACEMLFSYGFIDAAMVDAREVFVPLQMLDDDPLAAPKNHVSTAAPGVKFYRDADGVLKWHSDYIYLAVINQEDGLEFKWAQRTDGGQDLEMTWNDHPVATTEALLVLLKDNEKYDLFHLRAIMVLLQKAEENIDLMANVDVDVTIGEGTNIRESCYVLAMKLVELDGEFLMEAVAGLERERDMLMAGSEVVRAYLAEPAETEEGEGKAEAEEEDFT